MGNKNDNNLSSSIMNNTNNQSSQFNSRTIRTGMEGITNDS